MMPKSAIDRLRQDVVLPPGYEMFLDPTTDNIVVCNQEIGFTMTSAWCHDHSYTNIMENVRYGIGLLLAKTDGVGAFSIRVTSLLKNPPVTTTKWDASFPKTPEGRWREALRKSEAMERERIIKSRWTHKQVEVAADTLRGAVGQQVYSDAFWQGVARQVLDSVYASGEEKV